jgi:hypothetical protein
VVPPNDSKWFQTAPPIKPFGSPIKRGIKRDGVTEEVLYLQFNHLGLLVITMLRSVVEIREGRDRSSDQSQWEFHGIK